MASSSYNALANIALRLASLAGKFGLSLFVARFLDLAQLGIFGIIMGISMFMVVFIGGRIDFELCRQVALAPKETARQLLRDQSLFYGINFLGLLPLFLIVGSIGIAGFGIDVALCIWAICCLEAYANLLFVNTYALGKPLLANVAFFIRSGLWAFVAMALLLFNPDMRSLWTVLVLWIAGAALSVIVNGEILDIRKWPSLRRMPIDYRTLQHGLSTSFLIWVGSIGLAGGSYFDRLILSAYLDLETVGVATFYMSFSNAVVTLVTSSSLAALAQKLMKLADEKNWDSLWHEWRKGGRSMLVMGVVLSTIIAVTIPYSGFVLQKIEIYDNRYALWLLMLATILRLSAEAAFFGLYILRQDAPIWKGNLAFLFASLAANAIFIANYGMVGIAVANILAALFLFVYRFRKLANASKLVRLDV